MSSALDRFVGSKQGISEIRFELPGSKEELFLRPFTTKEQKAIMKALEKEDQDLANSAFDDLINACVVKPKSFNLKNIYSKDRDALLIKLRAESVKDTFAQQWKCEECSHKNTNEVQLSDLKLEAPETLTDTTVIDMTDRECKLSLGLVTRGDEQEMMKYVKKMSKGLRDLSKTELLNGALASCIKSLIVNEAVVINGSEVEEEKTIKLNFTDKIGILEEMALTDKKKIQDFLQTVENFGFDLKFDFQCSKCNNEQTVELEWLTFFIL